MASPEVASARAVDPIDHPLIEQLRDLARDETGPQRGGRLHLDFDAVRRAEERPSDATHTVAGLLNDIVVGVASVRRDRGDGITVAMIDELFVHPQARGVGVGAAMLETIQAWAIDAGCTHIESQVLPGNREAKNFFERMGLVTRKMRVSRELEQSGD